METRTEPRTHARRASRLGHLLAAITLATVATLGWVGRDYYRLDLARRARSPLHATLKPGGAVGRRLGLAGTALIALNLSYMARRRLRRLQSVGSPQAWLAVHVFCGITGPLLLVFHAAFLATNLVARVTAIATLVVVVTGLIGRYLYARIPRSVSGRELTLAELEARQRALLAELAALLPDEPRAALATPESPAREDGERSVPRLLLGAFVSDLRRVALGVRLALELRRAGLGWRRALAAARAATAVAAVRLGLAELEALRRILAAWRALHLRLALVMVVAAVVHIAVVSALGYGLV